MTEISLTARRRVLRGLALGVGALMAWPTLAKLGVNWRSPLHRLGKRALYPQRSGDARLVALFTAPEQAILTRMVELMLPSDGTAGARETGTAGAVLFTLGQQDDSVIAGIAQATAAIDAIAQQQFGQPFVALSDAQANQVMAIVAAEPAFAPFWNSVRNIAVLHFYAQPAAYQPLGMPGPSIDRGGFPGGRPRAGSDLCPLV